MSDEHKDKYGLLDVIQEKLVSRRLLTWLVATALLCFGFIKSDEWLFIALLWLGQQSTQDILMLWLKHRKVGNE